MFSTIQNLTHTVRMVYGDSERSYNGKLWFTPIHGTGQGNGASPAIWAVVSTPILNMLRVEGYGAFFECPITKEKAEVVGFAFVDDTDLVTVPRQQHHKTHFQQILDEMQATVEEWEGGIMASGGAIVPNKSHWYLIDFHWDNGEW